MPSKARSDRHRKNFRPNHGMRIGLNIRDLAEPATHDMDCVRLPITWHVPGLVWSLDDTELARFTHHNLPLYQVQDVASIYKFTPWVGDQVLGETVASRLEQLSLQHRPSLVLKRDNGSNLNQQAVEDVLVRCLIMPLNSPPHYPPYNRGWNAWYGTKNPAVGKDPCLQRDRGVSATRV